MRLILFFLFLFISSVIAAQNNTNAASKRIDTIHSSILNEDRYIWVHIPEKAISTGQRYPVIYILDGEVHFDEINDILKKLSKETGRSIQNEMIVVAIGNIWERYKDYSPTHISSSPWVDDYTAPTTGGGEKFISFLEKELFPHINTTSPASSTRILIGHSIGGLIATDILLKHTDMFSHYAVLDPSMWWDGEKLLQQSKVILANKTFEKKSLFIAVANTMYKDMDVKQIKSDTSVKTVLIRPSLTLVDYINANQQNKLRFRWKYYKDHHHMTVFPSAAYDALKFFLESL
ncbi:MAG TPA: alpha/beta hydrolase-fold protein [Chitinophagaceae bacterium]|jgi:hypothetical protein|nr:alpha/beta hydrolase-fold protein [Chitinophagaceae bacterium]